MKYRWVSWYSPLELGPFTLNHPWWISGTGFGVPDVGTADTICAAIPVESAEEAERIIRAAYDKPPDVIEWRFNLEKEGSPFTGRFPRAKWMPWPA